MKKTLLAIVLILATRLKGDDVKLPKGPLVQPFLRSVVIETENKRGSGVIVKTNLILSAFHLLEADSKVTVNDIEARVVSVDTEHDLILLEVPTHEVPPLEFAQGIVLGQELYAMTNPIGHTNLLSKGYVADFSDGKIFTNPGMGLWFGSSGGGVYDADGKFVGLAEALQESKMGGATQYPFPIITPAPVIAKFLVAYELRLQGKEPPQEESPPEDTPKKAANGKKVK